MKLVYIKPSTRLYKKYMALFSDGKVTHFGQFGSSTYLDHKDDKKKLNYIKRHKTNEDWTNPQLPGTLSKYILWNKTNIDESIKDYKETFKV